MLGCLLFKKFKKFSEPCSFSKADKMSSTYLYIKFGFVRIINENISKERSQGRIHGYSINLIIKFTIKKKMSLLCSKKEKFFKFF